MHSGLRFYSNLTESLKANRTAVTRSCGVMGFSNKHSVPTSQDFGDFLECSSRRVLVMDVMMVIYKCI